MAELFMHDVYTSRETKIQEKDFGMLWSVFCIVMTIAIASGVIVFIEEQSMVHYRVECALQDLQKAFF